MFSRRDLLIVVMSTTLAPEENLVSLVYVSSGTRQMDDSEILDILRASRNKNARLQITGMLLYKDGNFLQVLEGREEALSELMGYIERDNRHRGVITLLKKPLAQRQFPDWSMAFKNLSKLSPEDLGANSDFSIHRLRTSGSGPVRSDATSFCFTSKPTCATNCPSA